ncbi:uncharacterized protein N7483_006489 [Penicillium malachiteum]|uniref:uncharacterized protein n=1 Tax=Penicillium malachiteum TaxID=1324776 RepID=UPI00254758EF|nr:uncharacterized protein N7483_006489 [Penicillium malachiteum]KAJ5725132.1 hypothetical protein N7483_006489 [Penicillium malachiteum]
MQPTNSALSKRRRFQSSITTYFSAPESSASDPSLSHNHYSATTYSATPVVSAKVQASLLSVGMRVRKSVADGYKTQLSLEKEKVAPVMPTRESFVSQTYPSTTSSELAPFSGIPKSSNNLVTDDDAFSLPPSSQESVASSTTGPIGLNGQKRHLDNDIFADSDSDQEDDGFHHWQGNTAGRTILSPSLGQQRRRIIAAHKKSLLNQHSSMDLDDFEEATFLCRKEEVDADYQMDCA